MCRYAVQIKYIRAPLFNLHRHELRARSEGVRDVRGERESGEG